MWNIFSWLLLSYLHLPLVVKSFCLFRFSLIDIWLRETSSVLLRSFGNREQFPQVISFAPVLWCVSVGLLGCTWALLSLFGSKIRPSLVSKINSLWSPSSQCWIFLLSVGVLCLGGGRGVVSFVSAPVHWEEHHLQRPLKGKGRRMCHVGQSEEKIKLS